MARIVLCNRLLPPPGYPETRPLQLLTDLGHDVHTLSMPQSDRLPYDGITMWTASSYREMAWQVLRLRPDLLFLERPGPALALSLLVAPTWVRSLIRPRRARRAVARVGVDAVTFTNPAMASEWLTLPARRLDLPYPVDTAFWHTPPTDAEKIWQQLGRERPAGPVVTWVANITPGKQHAELVAWVGPMIKQRHGLLVLPGQVFEQSAATAIQTAIESLGLEAEVVLPGRMSPEEIRRLYAVTDVQVVNSRAETQCMAMYEGLAAGVPTLLFDIADLTSAFPMLPAHRDAESLQRNLTRMLDDGGSARALVRSQAVQDRVDWADIRRHDHLFRIHLSGLL